MNFGKVGVEMSYVQSQIHSDCDSAESIADSDLEDGELRKKLASPMKVRRRGDSESSRRPTASGKPEAVIIQKRGTSAQRTQADHSRRESLMSSSSQEPDARFFNKERRTGKPVGEFHVVLADPSNLERSLLEGNKDHLFSQATSELMRQEHQVGSLNNCINELQQQADAQRLEDAHHGHAESRREQVRLQEEYPKYARNGRR